MGTVQQVDVHRIGSDPDAFEAFYREHLALVGRFVARRVDDPHVAADLTAEVFLAAIDSAHGYRPGPSGPGGWLIGIARHVVAGEYRRQHRSRNAVDRIQGRRLLDPDATERIVERIDAERETRELYRALADLPRRDRALLELVAVDGLAVAEAAAVLGITAGAARVRLHRSRVRLQSQLWPVHRTALVLEAL
jgi:RNA polymerase sigma-70 factor (ECF subfamily)